MIATIHADGIVGSSRDKVGSHGRSIVGVDTTFTDEKFSVRIHQEVQFVLMLVGTTEGACIKKAIGVILTPAGAEDGKA